MSEYISKEEINRVLLNRIDMNNKCLSGARESKHFEEEKYFSTLIFEDEQIKALFEELPSADVRPNIHAYWKLVNPLQSDDGGAYCCSNCGSGTWGIVPRYWKGCPWCLAIMDGEPKGEKGTE